MDQIVPSSRSQFAADILKALKATGRVTRTEIVIPIEMINIVENLVVVSWGHHYTAM